MAQEIQQRIWDYIDGNGTVSEREEIGRLLKEDDFWRSEYEELVSIHAILQREELDVPSLRFSKNVMEEIAMYQVAPATTSYINKNVFRGIMVFFVTMLFGLIVYLVGQMHFTTQPTNNLIPNLNLNADRFDFSKILSNTWVNIFIGFNAILGLILFDKYLQHKKTDQQVQ